MHKSIRSASVALFAIGLATCADLTDNTRPTGLRRASFALAPQFEPTASRTVAALTALGIAYDRVRIVILRSATDTLKDSTLTIHPGDSPLTLELAVLAVPEEVLSATVQFRSATEVLFEGTANVTAKPSNSVSSETNSTLVTVKYTGPGATAKTLVISPGSGTYPSGGVTKFTAKAFDAANVEVPNVPVTWSVSDPAIASIDAVSGALSPKVLRGTVVVTATLAELVQRATVNLAPPAAGLSVVQGAAQTGLVGTQLEQPIIVQVVAADGLPAAGSGQTVTFAALTGGSVSPASVAVDVNGRAQSRFTLGARAGSVYLYSAKIGADSVLIPEIATVGKPTQLIPSGSTSLTLIAGQIPNPLPTFRVADSVGNSVPGVPLKVTVTRQGSTEIKTGGFIADTIGVGEITKVLQELTVASTYTVVFESSDPTVAFPSLTYTITIQPAAAAKLAFNVHPANAKANTNISPAFTVIVQDIYGNLVTTATTQITIVLEPSTTSGMQVLGTKIVNAVNGVATFSAVSMTPAKTGVRLQAVATGLSTATSNPFDITP